MRLTSLFGADGGDSGGEKFLEAQKFGEEIFGRGRSEGVFEALILHERTVELHHGFLKRSADGRFDGAREASLALKLGDFFADL